MLVWSIETSHFPVVVGEECQKADLDTVVGQGCQKPGPKSGQNPTGGGGGHVEGVPATGDPRGPTLNCAAMKLVYGATSPTASS
jgi:hypothetical protein